MECVDPNLVGPWFAGDLPPSERALIHDHLDSCDDCRQLFAELGRVFADAEVGPQAADAHGPITMGERVARYVIVEWLGAGGMGAVYGAYDPELDRLIAIKFLRTADDGGEAGQARLLREARTLARISHPHVVAVHDVGIHAGSVFVAMEYLRGGTLAEWLAREPRSASAVVAHFVDAGRGLAATHASDLVHRDFKPSNVLMGADGRVRVTDFGLARSSQVPETIHDDASWNGTPAYMSPEQRAGRPLDARSDQYSFCVALHEALFGALPNASSGRQPAARVPRRVRLALARGMSERPDDRFPSMERLLRELVSQRSRVVWASFAAGALVCLTMGTVTYVHGQARVCAGAASRLAGVWDGDRRKAVAAAFDGTGVSYSADAFYSAERALDAYASRWVHMRTETCEATRVQRTQSEEMMDLRVECLDRVARDLSSLVDVFAKADPKVVEKALSATVALPSIDACADTAGLRSRVRLPESLPARAESARLRAEIGRGVALIQVAKYAAAEAIVRPLVGPAKATGDLSVAAYADFALGTIRGRLGDFPAANAALYDAVSEAEATRDDLVKARALVQLTFLFAQKESKLDEALRGGQLALAVLTRLPEEVDLRANVEDHIASVEIEQGRVAEGQARGQRALAMREAAFGPDDFRVGLSLNNSSKALFLAGDPEKSLAYQRRALGIFRSTLGPGHPLVALALINAGLSELQLRRLDDAIRDASEGLALWQTLLGPDHPDLIMAEGIVATILKDQGKPEAALVHAERAAALAEKVFPGDHLNKVNVSITRGQIALKLGKTQDAVVLQARALAMCDRLGRPPDETAEASSDLGAAYLSAGRAAEAVPLLETARSLREGHPTDRAELAETRVLLARALVEVSAHVNESPDVGRRQRDLSRAIALASQARDAYAALPGYETESADATAWIAAHTVFERK